MSKVSAYECDRCGELFQRAEGEPRPVIQIKVSRVVTASYDLCPKCMEAHRQWFEVAEGPPE